MATTIQVSGQLIICDGYIPRSLLRPITNTKNPYPFIPRSSAAVGFLIETLKKRKQCGKESYEEVIWNLVEDTMKINEETKREIERARADIKAGKFYTHEQVKKKLRL